jgi:hypothetical protein
MFLEGRLFAPRGKNKERLEAPHFFEVASDATR